MKKHVVLALSVALLLVIVVSFVISFRLLPPISEMPVRIGDTREGKNWFGQPTISAYGFSIVLLVVAYWIKRALLTKCNRWVAILFFALFFLASLPYIWFLCESDWFNPFIYRISCWLGGPIAIWMVPTISFIVDLCRWPTATPLQYYLIRSVYEVMIIVPLWLFFWVFFSVFVLGWGWI